MAKTVIIIDECDAIMLRDLQAFYKATKGNNISVIGLTATAFDKSEGEEMDALAQLGYKIYRTGKDDELLKEPTIHERIKLDTTEKVIIKIREHKKVRGVLVYATAELYDEL